GRGQEDSFWEDALDLLLANTIDLCLLAYGKVTVQLLYEIAQSAPRKIVMQQSATPQQHEQQKHQAETAPTPSKPFKLAYDKAMEKTRTQVEAWKNRSMDKLRHVQTN